MKSEYYNNGNIPWMKSGEVNQGFIWTVNEKITQLGLDKSSAKIFPLNTVCIAMYGATVGKVGILKIESSTNQAVCGVLPNEKYLSEFLFYFLKSKKDDMVSKSVGGAQPNISQQIIKGLKIPIVDLNVQKEILQTLEEERQVIEGNKKFIEVYTQKIQDRINKVWGE